MRRHQTLKNLSKIKFVFKAFGFGSIDDGAVSADDISVKKNNCKVWFAVRPFLLMNMKFSV